MLTAAGANAGVLRGLPCLLGVMVGMGLMMFLVPLGLGSIVLQNPLVLKALHWGGAAVLLWMSWKIATSSRIDSGSGANPVGFLGAAVLQWINPKSWLVSASAAGTFLNPGAGSAGMPAPPPAGFFVRGGPPGRLPLAGVRRAGPAAPPAGPSPAPFPFRRGG